MFINAITVWLLRAAFCRQAVHALTAPLSRLAGHALTFGCWLRTGRSGARGHRDRGGARF
jgi:hypothetical protein